MHEAPQVKLEFEDVGFWGQGKTGVRGENPPGEKKRTNNNLNPGAGGLDGVALWRLFFPIWRLTAKF